MSGTTPLERRALERIVQMTDTDKLRTLMHNARKQGSSEVERAAFARLCEVQPSASPGSLEHDVWASIFALEEMLRDERGRTTLLSRTRQKIAKDGEAKTCADLINAAKPSDGFQMLIDRQHPALLFEAVALRHPDRFPQDVLDAARRRLSDNGVDHETLLGT
jgi:hypothetical protein